jgi:hypothetical protein
LVAAALAAGLGAAGGPPATARACRAIPEAVGIVDALNGFWRRSIRLCQARDPDINASAYPEAGVVRANRRWLADIADEYGASAVSGILAHEWAHMVQEGDPGPNAELQADCLAGAFMRRARFDRMELDRFVLLSLDSGDFRQDRATHGTGGQRRGAILRGYFGFRGQRPDRLAGFCLPGRRSD